MLWRLFAGFIHIFSLHDTTLKLNTKYYQDQFAMNVRNMRDNPFQYSINQVR